MPSSHAAPGSSSGDPEIDRLRFLRAELERHNHLYYVEARPEISDQLFDNWLKELESLEAKHPELFDPNSPTQRKRSALVKSTSRRQ